MSIFRFYMLMTHLSYSDWHRNGEYRRKICLFLFYNKQNMPLLHPLKEDTAYNNEKKNKYMPQVPILM